MSDFDIEALKLRLANSKNDLCQESASALRAQQAEIERLNKILHPIITGKNVIVPIEPTEKMVEAALASTSYHHNFEAQMGEHLSKLNVNREKMKIRYRAMLKASQEGE